jgi:hypothetical protein
VLRIRIHRIHMFLGLPDPDPLVRKALIPTMLRLFLSFYHWKWCKCTFKK